MQKIGISNAKNYLLLLSNFDEVDVTFPIFFGSNFAKILTVEDVEPNTEIPNKFLQITPF